MKRVSKIENQRGKKQQKEERRNRKDGGREQKKRDVEGTEQKVVFMFQEMVYIFGKTSLVQSDRHRPFSDPRA